MKALKAMFIAALVGASAAMTAYAEKLTIATVNNSDMIIMQELSSEFTKKTGHELNWVTLEENTRHSVSTRRIWMNALILNGSHLVIHSTREYVE